MHFGFLKRLAEVQQKLEPVLAELGLKAKLTERMGTRRISFHDQDGLYGSPVEIEFSSMALSNDDVGDWQGSAMVVHYYDTIEMGKAGWKHDLYAKGAGYEEFDDDYEDTFVMLREALQETSLIYIGEGLANYTTNENFALAFLFLEGIAAERNLSMDCERVDGIETIVIKGDRDNVWRVAITGRAATLSLNGELTQTMAPQSGSRIAETVADAIRAADTQLRM